MNSIITEITRRKLFRYASNDCVCEFISEPWERLHEASSRVSIGKKNRDDKISLYLRADSSSAHRYALSYISMDIYDKATHCDDLSK